MLPDLMPICVELPKWKDIKILPIGDLHIGSPLFMQNEWENTKKQLLNEKDTYCVIVGDMMDNGTKGSVCPYDNTMRPSEQKKWLSNELKDIKDKILCIVPGNHEYRSMKEVDDNPLYDVACKLDIEDRYRENGAFLLLSYRKADSNAPTYAFCVTHGAGGGMVGASANRNRRFGMAIDGLDCLITGHTHQPIDLASTKLRIDKINKQVIQTDFRCVVCTSYLKYGGYAMRGMMTPTSFARQEILLNSKKKEIKVLM